MDIYEEITEAKMTLGELAYKYSKACTFGNQSEELRMDFVRLAAYIRTMERNTSKKKPMAINFTFTEGQTIPFSSLTKQNNSLILDIEEYRKCAEVDCEPCLSDDDLCKIVEYTKLIASKHLIS